MELHDLFFLPNTILVFIKKTEMVGVCGTHRGDERCMQSLGGKTREKYTTCKTYECMGGYYWNGYKKSGWKNVERNDVVLETDK